MAVITYLEAISQALRDEMRRDENVILLGEDIAVFGGAFKVTVGFLDEFGEDRVIDTPISESGFTGAACGAAVEGLRPVVEFQFADFIACAFDQIVNYAAKNYYRWGIPMPVVFRGPAGGGFRGGPYHSQNPEAWFTHVPGLKVVQPSTPYDAKGLLIAAIRDNNPVIYFEHKHLYRQVYNKGRNPGPEYMIPFGKAKVRREGSDITVVTCGALVKRSLDAAKLASEQNGIEAEVIDLRTVKPLDMERIADSVKKTNKVMIVHEDSLSWGIGSEIAARIADELFPWLDGPIKRVASMDTWVAYAPQVENAILPQTPDVLAAMIELAAY